MIQRTIHSAFIFLAILVVPCAVRAVAITDVMFDPEGSDAGHEWVRIVNDGTTTIDLAKWRLVVGGKKHKLREAAGSSIVQPGTNAIVSNDATTYVSDHPEYHGTIFESSFSLPNAGGTVALIDDHAKTLVSRSYLAAPKAKKAKVVAPKKAKVSKSIAAKKSSVVASTSEDIQVDDSQDTTQLAVVSEPTTPSGVWWGAIALLGTIVSGALIYMNRLKKGEWQIADIEEPVP